MYYDCMCNILCMLLLHGAYFLFCKIYLLRLHAVHITLIQATMLLYEAYLLVCKVYVLRLYVQHIVHDTLT